VLASILRLPVLQCLVSCRSKGSDSKEYGVSGVRKPC
jgi:hypothetical protein